MASLAVATQTTSMSLLASSIKHLNTSGLKRDPSLLCNLTAFSVFIKKCQSVGALALKHNSHINESYVSELWVSPSLQAHNFATRCELVDVWLMFPPA